jgi:hypothetical protein
MSYKQKTPHLEIPVLGKRDRILPDVEMRKYTIIENMLIAGTKGISEVVFDDGTYNIIKDGDMFVVRLTAGGSYPSIQGIVGGFYVHAKPEVRWTKLKKGYLYYLYIRPTNKTAYQCDDIRPTALTHRIDKDSLLLATVDLRGDDPNLNTEPDGKVYSGDVARHASDGSNPHGRKLLQDELVVQKRLVIPEGAVVLVGDKEVPVEAFASTVAELGGRTIENVNFMSGGPLGTVVRVGGKVFSVQVQRRVMGGLLEGTVGEIGIGRFGEDDRADDDHEFVVYNTGDEEIPLKAIVICG